MFISVVRVQIRVGRVHPTSKDESPKGDLMKRIFLSGLMSGILAVGVAAQSTAAPPMPAPQGTSNAPAAAAPGQVSSSFPAGTVIAVELSKSLDAKKAKTGDQIEIRIPADVLAHGKILIPRSAKILGHVTEVKAHSKESPDSKVGLAFDRLVMKGGSEVVMQAVVQAISRPLQLVMASDARLNEDSGMSAGGSTASGRMDASKSMPPRSAERVAAIPVDSSSGSEPPSTMAPLGPTSQGVVGMKGLALKVSGPSSVVSSQTDNVHLESGTQMILRIQ